MVVENIERKIEDGLASASGGARRDGEVTRPIISIMLVLCAVFVPVAFVSGLTGQFYRQFGITIAASTHHLHIQLPDALARAGGDTLEAAERAAGLPFSAQSTGCWGGSSRVLQPRVRARFGALRPWCARVSPRLRGSCLRDLRRAAGVHLGHFPHRAGRLHSVARQAVSGRHRAAARRGLAGSHRKGGEADLGNRDHTPGVDHAIGFSGLSVQGFVNLSNAAVCFFPLTAVRGAHDQGSVGRRHRGRAQQEVRRHSGRDRFSRCRRRRCRVSGTPADSSSIIQDRGAHGYDELARVTNEVIARRASSMSSIPTRRTRRFRTAFRSCMPTWIG